MAHRWNIFPKINLPIEETIYELKITKFILLFGILSLFVRKPKDFIYIWMDHTLINSIIVYAPQKEDKQFQC
jgi:hypothetical protein